MGRQETFYELIRRQGISRRNFLKFCSLSAASLGLAPHFAGKIAHAMETKPRVPVLWLHGLECTCCTESFIRSAHPLAKDVILSMVSLDYDDTIMAAAGHQAEQAIADVMGIAADQCHWCLMPALRRHGRLTACWRSDCLRARVAPSRGWRASAAGHRR